MAARGGVPSTVLGFVAVPTEGGMGRIGYVVYERIPEVAAASQRSEGEVLGVIVAHDIRRLILGADPQPGDGVTEDRGNRRDRERANPLALQFTPSEIARLHACSKTIRRRSLELSGREALIRRVNAPRAVTPCGSEPSGHGYRGVMLSALSKNSAAAVAAAFQLRHSSESWTSSGSTSSSTRTPLATSRARKSIVWRKSTVRSSSP